MKIVVVMMSEIVGFPTSPEDVKTSIAAWADAAAELTHREAAPSMTAKLIFLGEELSVCRYCDKVIHHLNEIVWVHMTTGKADCAR